MENEILENRRGYQWPAQALTGQEMKILAEIREKTSIPISEILRQAVIIAGRKKSQFKKKGGTH